MIKSKLLLMGLLVVVGLSDTAQGAMGQAAVTAGKKALMEDLAFISGRWQGAMEGASMNEEWSVPMGDSMMGMFRIVKGGKPTFYEFLVIERTNSVPVLKLKHFNAGLVGWEEKNQVHEFPLVELEKNRAVFERADKETRLTYQRTYPMSLTAILQHTVNGKSTTEEFRFTRIP